MAANLNFKLSVWIESVIVIKSCKQISTYIRIYIYIYMEFLKSFEFLMNI